MHFMFTLFFELSLRNETRKLFRCATDKPKTKDDQQQVEGSRVQEYLKVSV